MPWINEASPLETYNSLEDRHLVHFFRSARMRKHLIKTGLVTKDGEIRPEAEYREIRNRENQKRALLEIIAQAIVERSLEAERLRQGKIRRTLEEICKLHRVRRIREERQKRAEENILMQLVPRSPRSSDKLQPLAGSSSDNSTPLKNGTLVVDVSDIDEPELAVMDKTSQKELAKLQRFNRKQQIKERQAGQPPYLYLREPGTPQRTIGGGRRTRENGRSRLKRRGQEIEGSRKGSKTRRCKPQGDSKHHAIHEVSTAMKYKDEDESVNDYGDRLITDELQASCCIKNMPNENRSDRSVLRFRSSSASEGSPQKLSITETAVDEENKDTLSNNQTDEGIASKADTCDAHSININSGEHRKSKKYSDGPLSNGGRPYTAALVFSVDKPTKGVLLEGLSDRDEPKRSIRSATLRHFIAKGAKKNPYGSMPTPLEQNGSVCTNKRNTHADAMVTVANFDGKESDRSSDEQISYSYKNRNLPFFERKDGVLTEQLLPPISDKMNLVKSPCVVKFMYLGASRSEEANLRKTQIKSKRLPEHQESHQPRIQSIEDELKTARLITVIQQPSGGNTVTVFKGYLNPGDVFEFTSRRAYGYPFSLTLCIDGNQHARVSTCCEYRHRRGVRIGGKAGHFVYLNVEGSIPCFKCQAAKSIRQERQKQTKKKLKYRQAESGDIIRKSSVAIDSSDLTLEKESEVVTSNTPHGSITMKVELVEEDSEKKPESSTNHYQPVCTNLNRRIVKSTTWECFSPTAGQMQMNIASDNSQLADDVGKKSLQYGIEHETEGHDFQQVRPLTDCSSHFTPFSDTDNRISCSVDLEPSHDYTADREDFEAMYEVDDMENEYSDEKESTTDDSDEDDVKSNDTDGANSQTKPDEHEYLFQKAMHQLPDDDMAQSDRSSRLLTESQPSLSNIFVEKVDTVYQHRMSTVCKHHLSEPKHVLEPNDRHTCDNVGQLSEENIAGDTVEKMTNIEIYCTDVAEETPVQEYSVADTQGTGSSCASGDQQNVDVTWLSGFTSVHHKMNTPNEINARIPLIVIDSDEIDHRFTLPYFKGECHASYNKTQCSVLETTNSKQSCITRSDVVVDECELTASFLSNHPLSPRSLSRTTASRSITFTSSMSQCKTPIKLSTTSPDSDCQRLDEWHEINMPPNKTSGKASALATETSEFFSVHASPQFMRDRICSRTQFDGSLMRPVCDSSADYSTPERRSPDTPIVTDSRMPSNRTATSSVTNLNARAQSTSNLEKLI